MDLKNHRYNDNEDCNLLHQSERDKGMDMSHVFQIPDDLYTKLATYAAQHNQTPETLFLAWAREVTQKQEKAITSGTSGPKEEDVQRPLFQIAGMFALNEPGWADKHDHYLAEAYLENHAEEK
jgi:hypothetical protein